MVDGVTALMVSANLANVVTTKIAPKALTAIPIKMFAVRLVISVGVSAVNARSIQNVLRSAFAGVVTASMQALGNAVETTAATHSIRTVPRTRAEQALQSKSFSVHRSIWDQIVLPSPIVLGVRATKRPDDVRRLPACARRAPGMATARQGNAATRRRMPVLKISAADLRIISRNLPVLTAKSAMKIRMSVVILRSVNVLRPTSRKCAGSARSAMSLRVALMDAAFNA